MRSSARPNKNALCSGAPFYEGSARLNRDRQVFLASTASQAFSMVERLGFSVALVDLELPGDAYTLIQRLHDANPDLLIIAIISGAMKASVFEATKDFGGVEVLKKPITPEWKPVVERIRARRAHRN